MMCKNAAMLVLSILFFCARETLLASSHYQSTCPFSTITQENMVEVEKRPSKDQVSEDRQNLEPERNGLRKDREIEDRPEVTIIVTPQKSGTAPLKVYFKARTKGLDGPLRFYWVFGDSSESDLQEPGLRVYGVGRFNVILTVIDKNGKKYSASVTIESRCKG